MQLTSDRLVSTSRHMIYTSSATSTQTHIHNQISQSANFWDAPHNWLQGLNVIVHHMYMAPRHTKSNGLAENFVKTIKSAISAVEIHDIIDLERAIYAFLFQYRNVVHKMTNQCPNVLFHQEILRHPIICDANVLFCCGE